MTKQKSGVNPKVLVIVGPTASGKSALAMDIARRHNGELICADSRTVYRGMDIGTAKPTTKDRARIPHYLLDVVTPDESFTAAEFKQRAEHLIKQISSRGKLPIIVGGTGLYIDSLLFDYMFGKPADATKRAALEALSVQDLQRICEEQKIDLPENSQNKRYLIRAIELGGLIKHKHEMRENSLVIGIKIEREALRSRIDDRAHEMFKAGIIGEARALAAHYGWDNEAMTGGIYRVLRPLLEGQISEQEALDDFVRSDMRLAKKQMTWFKRNPHIVWGTPYELNKQVDDFLRKPISS